MFCVLSSVLEFIEGLFCCKINEMSENVTAQKSSWFEENNEKYIGENIKKRKLRKEREEARDWRKNCKDKIWEKIF